ncbi:MAG: hypothetical protein AB7V43_13055 [Acidimicrobiia bacterium]
MTTYLDEWGLTADDDNFHPRNDDPWWTETFWLAWFVPDRKLIGYIYPIFRPNVGVQGGGVMVYDDTGDLEWQMPVYDFDWHRQFDPSADLRDITLGSGLTIRCLEPARKFEVTYSSRDITLHLVAQAAIKPLVTLGTPPFNKGHIDQICHVTGEMTLKGETIPVDCLSMRDRSWGPRQDGRQPTVGYEYATQDPDNAFLAVSVCDKEEAYKADPVYTVTTGFLMRDGVWSRVCGGTRTAERDIEGHPLVVRIEAVDELGRTISAVGRAANTYRAKSYPSMLCLQALMEFEFDGRRGWGEVQDCWHPRRWRDRLEALTTSGAVQP